MRSPVSFQSRRRPARQPRFLAALLVLPLLAAGRSPAASLVPPATPIPSTYFGLNVESPDDQAAPPAGAWRLWDAGVGWRDVEPRRGQWDFTRLDALVDRAQQNGAEVLYVFGMTPQWAAARPDEPGNYNLPGMASAPADLNDWKTFVATLAQRYKGRIRQWEIWNEPNDPGYFSGSQATLLQMAGIAWSALKAADPANQVVAPSVSPAGGADLGWLDAYLSGGGGASADVMNYHLYVFNGQPEDMVGLAAQVKTVLANHGQQNKPLWDTEAGWLIASAQHPLDNLSGVGPVLSAQRSADYLARAYALNWAAGVGRFFWYAWDDNNFGLVETDGATVKPAAQAWVRTRRWLAGARMAGCGQNGGNWTCALTLSDGRNALLAWAPGGGALALPPGWPGAAVSRLDGSTGQVAAGASVALGDAPLLLTSAGTAASPPPSAVDTAPPDIAIVAPAPGARVGASVRVAARLSDNVGVVRAQLYVDGRLLNTLGGSRMPGYSVTWSGMGAGWHHVQIKATDAAGNWRLSGVWVQR